MPCKVLVTGASGQLAKTIKQQYALNQDNIEFTFADKAQLDISNDQTINSFFNTHSFDYCINCAAYTNVEKAEEEPHKAFLINAQAVNTLALKCRETNTVFIHISTDYVFDGKKNQPYTEKDITQPINQYGKSKEAGEQYIQENCPKHFILRTSWLYSIYGKNFLKTIVSKIKANETLNIIDSQTGIPTSTTLVAEFCYFLIKSKENTYGVYHVTASGKTSWFGFARAIADYFPMYENQKINPVAEFKTKAERPKYSVLSNQKALAKYPKILSWQEDLKRTIQPILT